jgi:hypothetical protein
MTKEIIEIQVKIDGEQTVGQLEKDLQKVGGQSEKAKVQVNELKKSVGASTKQMAMNFANVGTAIGGVFGGISGEFTELQARFIGIQQAVTALSSLTTLGSKKATEAIKVQTTATTLLGKAMQGGVRVANILKTALIASGIGAVVVALGILLAYFNRTQKGADKLQQITTGLQVAFDKLVNLIIPLGEWLMKAFEDPQKAVKDLWEAIKTNIINRVQGIILLFKSLGTVIQGAFNLDSKQIEKGFKDFLNSTTQIATGVEDVIGKMQELGKEIAETATQAATLKRRMQENERAQAKFNVEVSKNSALYKELLVQAEDINKTTDVRLKSINQAESIILGQTNKNIKLAKDRLEIIKDQNALLTESKKDADLQKEYDVEIEIARLESEKNDRLREFKSLRKGIVAEQQAQIQAQLQKEIEYNDLLENIRIKSIKDQTQQRIAEIEQTLEKELRLYKGNTEKEIQIRKELERLAQLDIQNILKEDADAKLELRREQINKEFALMNQFAQTEEERLALELANNEALFAEKLISVEDYEDKKFEIENKYRAKAIKEEKNNLQQKNELYQNSINAINSINNLFNQLQINNANKNNKDMEAIQRKMFNREKALKIALATADSFRAVTNYLATPTPDTALPGLKIANAIALGAAGLAQVLAIASTNFEGGGVPSINSGGATPNQGLQANVPIVGSITEVSQTTGETKLRAYVVQTELTAEAEVESKLRYNGRVK